MSLYDAAEAGDLARVALLVEQGADINQVGGRFKETALCIVARNGHLEVVRNLMEQGADIEKADVDGDTLADDEEIKQAIRDEPRRRLDHGHKRATEQDRHPNAATLQGEEEGDEQEQDIKQAAGEGEVADEDQDSEPSSDEEGGK